MTLAELQELLRNGKADKARYKEYALLCHPDLNKEPLAEQVFRQLQDFMEEKPVCTLRGKGTYQVLRQLAEGSISDVHQCDNEHVLKVALSSKEGVYIRHEFELLTELKTDKVYQKLLPLPVELLKVDNRDAAVYKTVSPLFLPSHWGKLPAHHLGWIFKRLLMVLGHAHSLGIVHGNIDSSHILINPHSRGIQLVGWSFSGKIGYKPNKKPAIAGRPTDDKYDSSTDIYMAAYAMREFLKDPHPLKNFLDSLLVNQRARPDNAWDLHEELDRFLVKYFGKNFVPLVP